MLQMKGKQSVLCEIELRKQGNLKIFGFPFCIAGEKEGKLA